MPSGTNSKRDANQPMVYQIRIKGHLGRGWTDWFDGLTITLEEDGNTLLNRPGARSGCAAWMVKESS